LLKNLKNTTGDYFFLPHPVHTNAGNVFGNMDGSSKEKTQFYTF